MPEAFPVSSPGSGGRPREIVVATRNEGKLRELVPMVEARGLRPVTLLQAGLAPTLEEDAIEVFETFEENALAKARWYLRACARPGAAVLSDDSGLAVDALGGAPGVHSKRWTGRPLEGQALHDDNNRSLVRALKGVADRRARYVCVAAIAWVGGELTARGECAGTIVDVPRGTAGFGYDPHFLSDELGMTFGEASREQKAAISHRARAVAALLRRY